MNTEEHRRTQNKALNEKKVIRIAPAFRCVHLCFSVFLCGAVRQRGLVNAGRPALPLPNQLQYPQRHPRQICNQQHADAGDDEERHDVPVQTRQWLVEA